MIGKRLKYLRKKKGYTLQTVSEKIGVARSTYAGYEADYRQPPLDVLHDLSKVLDTSTDYLLGLTDNPYPKEPTKNVKELLQELELHYDGVPLSDEELKPLRDIMEIIVRDRLQQSKKEDNDENKTGH